MGWTCARSRSRSAVRALERPWSRQGASATSLRCCASGPPCSRQEDLSFPRSLRRAHRPTERDLRPRRRKPGVRVRGLGCTVTAASVLRPRAPPHRRCGGPRQGPCRTSGPSSSPGSEAASAWVRPRHASGPDRKSTRLNSSHTVISYAVFCLKKKKKNNIFIFTDKKKKKKYN